MKKLIAIVIMTFIPHLALAHDEKIVTQMECTGGYVFKTTYVHGKYVTTVSTIQVLTDASMGPKPLRCNKYDGPLVYTDNKKK